MAVAIALILLEIFLLPGITIAGAGGLLFAIGGLVYAYTISVTAGTIVLAASVIIFAVAFFWLLRSKSFNSVALHTEVDSRLVSSRELGIKAGDNGVTLSRLAPIGKARIGNITVEAKSMGEFIDEDVPVTVVRVEGYNVVVKPEEESDNI